MNINFRCSNWLIQCILFCGLSLPLATQANNADKEASQVENIFAQFSLADTGLNFPPTKEVLAGCKKAKEKGCLNTFKRAMNAKKLIAANVSEKKLIETLLVINRACHPANKPSNSLACNGALISLFFYKNSAFDSIILAALKNMSVQDRSFIFNSYFHWYGNRPDPKPWIDYIQSAPIEWTTSESKRITLEYFTTPVPPPYWLAP